MTNNFNLTFMPFTEEDIPELTQLMKGAFDYDTKLHLGEDKGGPDGYDDGSFLRKWGLNNNSTHYKILLDNKLIGGIILWINKNNENFLGNVFVDVNLQNKGIGLAIWKRIEQMYPQTKVWRTDTPSFSYRNHNFYVNKCGFHVVRIENPTDILHGSYLLEKRMESKSNYELAGVIQ